MQLCCRILCSVKRVAVGSKSKQWKLDDVLNILATGFLKGGTGFLKSSAAGEMIKGGGSVNREIRVGITHVSVVIL